jgi:hypothetical protein
MRELLIRLDGPADKVRRCSAARSTLLGSSILALRERGHFDRYVAQLDGSERDAVLLTPAGVWLPISVAEAHYRACDALALSADEILAMGNAVARLTQKTVLALALRLATESGTTPWAILHQTPKLWARLYQGSSVELAKLGPKDAELAVFGNSLAQFAYWRTGLRGIIGSMAAPFARTVYVREIAHGGAANFHVAYRISWV